MRQQLDSIVIRMPFEKLLITMAQHSGSESTSGLTSIVILRKKSFRMRSHEHTAFEPRIDRNENAS